MVASRVPAGYQLTTPSKKTYHVVSRVAPLRTEKFSGACWNLYEKLKSIKNDEEKATGLCIRHKSLKMKTVYSVSLEAGATEAEPATAMVEKGVMQIRKKLVEGSCKLAQGQ